MNLLRVAAVLFTLLFVSVSITANAGVQAEYQVIDLGAFQTYEKGINNLGQVVGYDNASSRLVFWDGNTFVDIGLPQEGTASSPIALNNSGDILVDCAVDYYSTPFLYAGGEFLPVIGMDSVTAVNSGRLIAGSAYFPDPFIGTTSHAAVLKPDGEIADLGTLGGYFSFAWDISENGRVVGWSDTAGNGPTRAFMWENGVMKDLGGLPGSTFTEARAISNNGVYAAIVSQLLKRVRGTTVSISRSLRWDSVKTLDLGTLGGAYADARDVNNSGIVVGCSQSPRGEYAGYRSIPGRKMENLNRLIGRVPYYITCGQGINDQGDIYCEGFNTTGEPAWHALILKKLTPRRSW